MASNAGINGCDNSSTFDNPSTVASILSLITHSHDFGNSHACRVACSGSPVSRTLFLMRWMGMLALLAALVLAVLATGQFIDLQTSGESLGGALGTFFGNVGFFGIVAATAVAVAMLAAVVGLVLK